MAEALAALRPGGAIPGALTAADAKHDAAVTAAKKASVDLADLPEDLRSVRGVGVSAGASAGNATPTWTSRDPWPAIFREEHCNAGPTDFPALCTMGQGSVNTGMIIEPARLWHAYAYVGIDGGGQDGTWTGEHMTWFQAAGQKLPGVIWHQDWSVTVPFNNEVEQILLPVPVTYQFSYLREKLEHPLPYTNIGIATSWWPCGAEGQVFCMTELPCQNGFTPIGNVCRAIETHVMKLGGLDTGSGVTTWKGAFMISNTGNWEFDGSVHDSSAWAYADTWGVALATHNHDGSQFGVIHQGTVSGTFEPGSRDDVFLSGSSVHGPMKGWDQRIIDNWDVIRTSNAVQEIDASTPPGLFLQNAVGVLGVVVVAVVAILTADGTEHKNCNWDGERYLCTVGGGPYAGGAEQ
jgi:hypothetical protein